MKKVTFSTNLVFYAALFISGFANAGSVHKCTNKDGTVSFTDGACNSASKVEAVKIVVNDGMDSSDIREKMYQNENNEEQSNASPNVVSIGGNEEKDEAYEAAKKAASTPYPGSKDGRLTAKQLQALRDLELQKESENIHSNNEETNPGVIDDSRSKNADREALIKEASTPHKNSPNGQLTAAQLRTLTDLATGKQSADDSAYNPQNTENHSDPSPVIFVNCDQSGCNGTNGKRYNDIGGGNFVDTTNGQVGRPTP